MNDELIGGLRGALDALSQSRAGADDDERRSRLLRQLAALYRQADEAQGALARFKDEVRALADQIRADGGRPAGQGVADRVRVREDRLGASTFIEKGWHLISLGDYEGAAEALHRALELAPGELHAGALLGWAQMLQGRHDDAMATLGGVLEREPGNALARVNVGYICLRKRIFGEAIEHLSRVVRESSDRKAILYAHHYLGLVYFDRGMFEDAVPFFHQALALGPNLTEARFELGRALWFSGRPGEALAAWTTGADGGGDTPWAVRCREMLALVREGGEIPRASST